MSNIRLSPQWADCLYLVQPQRAGYFMQNKMFQIYLHNMKKCYKVANSLALKQIFRLVPG